MLAAMAAHSQRRSIERICAWRICLLLLVLVTATAQQLIARTHWHQLAIAQVNTSSSSPLSPAPDTRHADCLLCQIASHAGAAAPPAAMPQALVASNVREQLVPQAHYPVSILRPAHAWQSRGPPTV